MEEVWIAGSDKRYWVGPIINKYRVRLRSVILPRQHPDRRAEGSSSSKICSIRFLPVEGNNNSF